jgi:hypothetical protein
VTYEDFLQGRGSVLEKELHDVNRTIGEMDKEDVSKEGFYSFNLQSIVEELVLLSIVFHSKK